MSTTSIIVLAIAVILLLWAVSRYNRFVRLRNNRENAFADIDVQLKQRYDLIPQLVSVVKGYASHERDTLERVISARNQAINATSINEKVAADNVLSSALAGMRVTVEAYPQLKADKHFLDLQLEIEDMENKLSASRRYFNSATREINDATSTFPANIIAGMFGFRKEPMFDLGADRKTYEAAPQINF